MSMYKPFAIVVDHCTGQINIEVVPLNAPEDKKPDVFEIIINGIREGIIYYLNNQWISFTIKDKSLVEIIGTCIYKLYEKGDSMLKKLIPAKFAFN